MVGCVYGVYPIGYSVLWRGLSVGYGVYVWQVQALGVRMHGVGVWCAMAYAWRWVGVYMACVGTVYGVQALGVRMVSVCVCVGCMRWVYVCMSIYDVVSV